MSIFSRLFGRGSVFTREPTTVEIHGRPLRCQVCACDLFWRRQIQLNTTVATFFDLDWLDREATCVVCDHCGYIHWFLPPAAK